MRRRGVSQKRPSRGDAVVSPSGARLCALQVAAQVALKGGEHERLHFGRGLGRARAGSAQGLRLSARARARARARAQARAAGSGCRLGLGLGSGLTQAPEARARCS